MIVTAGEQSPGPGSKFISHPLDLAITPVFFGRAYLAVRGARSYFELKKPLSARVGPWWRFGVQEVKGVKDMSYGLYEVVQ